MQANQKASSTSDLPAQMLRNSRLACRILLGVVEASRHVFSAASNLSGNPIPKLPREWVSRQGASFPLFLWCAYLMNSELDRVKTASFRGRSLRASPFAGIVTGLRHLRRLFTPRRFCLRHLYPIVCHSRPLDPGMFANSLLHVVCRDPAFAAGIDPIARVQSLPLRSRGRTL